MSDETISRRDFVAGVGMALGLVAVPALTAFPEVAAAAPAPAAPWTYTWQDPEAVARRAFDIYYSNGCAEATWYPLVEALAADTKNPDAANWATIPKNLFNYGGGGVNGWGTLCGTCNGSAAIIKMMKKSTGPVDSTLVDGALEYYAGTPLPTNGTEISARRGGWTPSRTVLPNVPTSTAHSQLCHASLSEWMMTSGAQDGSVEQKDRCAKACFDMAFHTVELLNAWLADGTKPATAWAANIAACAPCHLPSKNPDNTTKPAVAPMKSKMTCDSCHDESATHLSK
jgi:hypothetical protein